MALEMSRFSLPQYLVLYVHFWTPLLSTNTHFLREAQQLDSQDTGLQDSIENGF